jgi:hypothetical protein
MSYSFKEFAKVGIISELGTRNIGKMTETFVMYRLSCRVLKIKALA